MTITLTDLLLPLKKWWWLLLLSAALAGGVSYLVTMRQPAQYQSRAILMIGQGIDNPNPTSNQLYLEQQLATTYANLANREPVRQAVMEALQMTWLPQYRAAALPNTQMFEVVVVDTLPERAQQVAQAIADQLISRSPSGETSKDDERQQFIQEQLDTLQSQIETTQLEMSDLQNLLGDLDSAREIEETRGQIAALETKLRTLQSNYADLYATTQQARVNNVQLIERPRVPTRPIGPNNLLTAAMAAGVGLSLAAGGVYLMHFLDKSVKSVEEVTRLIPAPVLGAIPKMPNGDSVLNFVSRQPRSPISDAFRSLRTNLDFLGTTRPIKTILVTGAMSADGKSTIASNLARIIAQAQRTVILLDGDLRNSTLQADMDLSDKPGLSNVLIGQATLDEVLLPLADAECAWLVPSGPLPPNPTELLESAPMRQAFAQLKEKADVIIVDGPPFIVTDAAILSEEVDGIILVVQIGHTHRDAIKAMMEQITLLKAPLLGIVFNRHENHPGYYSSYYHHSEKKPSRLA
jgi:capsular exopolysaccharide synthesis family protein